MLQQVLGPDKSKPNVRKRRAAFMLRPIDPGVFLASCLVHAACIVALWPASSIEHKKNDKPKIELSLAFSEPKSLAKPSSQKKIVNKEKTPLWSAKKPGGAVFSEQGVT